MTDVFLTHLGCNALERVGLKSASAVYFRAVTNDDPQGPGAAVPSSSPLDVSARQCLFASPPKSKMLNYFVFFYLKKINNQKMFAKCLIAN